MNIANVIAQLNDKNNFNKLIDFILTKINVGIDKYSVSELQELGRIIDIINRYNKAKYHDDKKVGLLNTKLIEAFEKVVKDDNLDSIKEVLGFYPAVIIDELIIKYPKKSNVTEKSKNIKNLIEEMKSQFIFQEERKKVRSNKAIKLKLNGQKMDEERVYADNMLDKINDSFNTTFDKIKIQLNKNKEDIEKQIEDIKETWAPFFQSEYTKEDIKKWLEDIEDKGLFNLEGIDIEVAAEEINEYMHLHPFVKKETVEKHEETDVVPEAEAEGIDFEKTENRIQKVIETDVEGIQKKIIYSDEDMEKEKQEADISESEHLEKEEDSTGTQGIKVKLADSSHYDQSEVASKLKDKHKKGMSI